MYPRRQSRICSLNMLTILIYRNLLSGWRAPSPAMNILDPQYLLLGGGVLAMAGFPLARLERLIRSHLRSPHPASGLTIAISGVSEETGCRGACLAAQRRLKQGSTAQSLSTSARHLVFRSEA